MPVRQSHPDPQPASLKPQRDSAKDDPSPTRRSIVLANIKQMHWLSRPSAPPSPTTPAPKSRSSAKPTPSPKSKWSDSPPSPLRTKPVAPLNIRRGRSMDKNVVMGRNSSKSKEREQVLRDRSAYAPVGSSSKDKGKQRATEASTSRPPSRNDGVTTPTPPSSSASNRAPRPIPPPLRSALKRNSHTFLPPSPALPSSAAPFNRLIADSTDLGPFDPQLISGVPPPGSYSRQSLVTLETSSLTLRTTLDTLLSRPSHLATYLLALCPSPATGRAPTPGEVIHIFLDRPSTPYPVILSYLRLPVSPRASMPALPRAVQLPSTTNGAPAESATISMIGVAKLEGLLDLRDEARWLGLTELDAMCDAELRSAGLLAKSVTIDLALPSEMQRGSGSTSSTCPTPSSYTSTHASTTASSFSLPSPITGLAIQGPAVQPAPLPARRAPTPDQPPARRPPTPSFLNSHPLPPLPESRPASEIEPLPPMPSRSARPLTEGARPSSGVGQLRGLGISDAPRPLSGIGVGVGGVVGRTTRASDGLPPSAFPSEAKTPSGSRSSRSTNPPTTKHSPLPPTAVIDALPLATGAEARARRPHSGRERSGSTPALPTVSTSTNSPAPPLPTASPKRRPLSTALHGAPPLLPAPSAPPPPVPIPASTRLTAQEEEEERERRAREKLSEALRLRKTGPSPVSPKKTVAPAQVRAPPVMVAVNANMAGVGTAGRQRLRANVYL